MAHLTRSAKSGGEWMLDDLDSYKISLKEVDPYLFFGLQELPQPLVDQELLENVDAFSMKQNCYANLISHLDFAMTLEWPGSQSSVIDFTAVLFDALDYVRRGRLACRRKELPLFICGEHRRARADVCLMDRSLEDSSKKKDFVCVVRAIKMSKQEVVNAPAQLVAQAVAAFTENNVQREAIGQPPLAEKVMPGIVMIDTSPVFFKIPVTQTLLTHIQHGSYPLESTCVTFCNPPIPRPSHRYSEGMRPLDNRLEILKCYEAFKAIVGN